MESPECCSYAETGSRKFLYSIWHDQILITLFCGKPIKMAGLVSKHADGSLLADVLEALEILPVRGSTSRGGTKALRNLLETVHDYHVTITPDGPRGPRHQMKSGIVFLASQTGRSIVPVAHICKNGWRIKGSWTDMAIPKPFSKICIIAGEPMTIPTNLDRTGINRYTQLLQKRMEELESHVYHFARTERHEGIPFRRAA